MAKGLKMGLNRLTSKLAKLEGKKSQVKIGDIREVVRLLATLVSEDFISRLVFDAYVKHIEKSSPKDC